MSDQEYQIYKLIYFVQGEDLSHNAHLDRSNLSRAAPSSKLFDFSHVIPHEITQGFVLQLFWNCSCIICSFDYLVYNGSKHYVLKR